MLRLSLFCVGAGLMAFMVACSTSAPPAADTRDADLAAVKAAEVAWSKDAGTKDPAQFVKYYAADATVMIPNAPAMHGPDEAAKAFKPLMADPNFSLSFTGVAADIAKSSDIAYTQGTYTMTVSDPKGKPLTDKGKYLTVWKKQADGSWKAVEDILNTDLPMPAPPK